MLKNSVIAMLFTMVCGCASQAPTLDSPSPVLEPVDPIAEQLPIEPPVSEELAKLKAKFSELGYEGVGMEVESAEVLSFLMQVFSSPVAVGRKIQAVYTGAANDYDASHESLTIGGTRDVKTVLAFIKKKIPVRKVSKKP
jgi:hypothetical protein